MGENLRLLDKLIEDYIDARIAPYPVTIRPTALQLLALRAMLGIHEEGDNSGTLVSAIQSTIGTADHTAWCMSLQQTAVAFVEKKLGVKSDLPAGEHCLTVFNEAVKLKQNVTNPAIGDLIVWQHGNSFMGHVGCLSAVHDKYFLCIEGNTSGGTGNAVDRDGDGVFERKRLRVPVGEMQIRGYLRARWLLPK